MGRGAVRWTADMDALITSATVVALAETGDKTQILSMVLAGRWQRPVPILLGILVATLANHLPAALIGVEIASVFDATVFRWVTAVSFVAMAVWILVPDRADDDVDRPPRGGVFVATAFAFFLAEMGDKTQLATVALGSRFRDVFEVATGTTIGMMLANVPAVLLGGTLMRRLDGRYVRPGTAVVFAGLAVFTLI